MFKKFARFLLPNPFDRMLKKLSRKRSSEKAHVLLAWNRGLGDIALGLYAMIERIRTFFPHGSITFLIRENLRDGFSLLPGVRTIVAPFWKRGEPYDVLSTLHRLNVDSKQFDLIIDKPNPTDWVRWQLGVVVPKLQWKEEYDFLVEKFDLPQEFIYIGAQISAETSYGLWRNWPEEKWKEFLALLPQNIKLIVFGVGETSLWNHSQVVDLRGKTTLFEMISIIKHRCSHLVLPDSGVLSMIYYLDQIFPIQVVSLWADPNHGILKQNVRSPNPLLVHFPLISDYRDLSTLPAKRVYDSLFPSLRSCKPWKVVSYGGERLKNISSKVGCVILAGGQGTRLGFLMPKGMFPLRGKTLFERIVNKIPERVPIAIMTSPVNHEETVQYFEKHQYFGKKISFFQQTTLPLLDENKRPCGIEGADGNGSFYRCFAESGILAAWSRQGVQIAAIMPVDNALADPLDLKHLSMHQDSLSEVTIRCIERNSPEEAMGVLVDREGKLEVLEYCDIDSKLLYQVERDGRPTYLYAYAGLISLNLSFIQRAALFDLPLHWVQKNVQHQGSSHLLWKGEKFLFDAFPLAQSIAVLCSPREECYAPLKTKEGPNGIDAVERILCQ
jgi:UDP-N-acetylglucosamine/UDP-N-acetylgalactosamine diphosphorylase